MFVQLTTVSEQELVSVNFNLVIEIHPLSNGTRIVYGFVLDGYYIHIDVTEEYEVVISKLKS